MSLPFQFATYYIIAEGSQSFLGAFWLGNLLLPFIPTVTPAQGAHTTLFAATSNKVQFDKRKYAGTYLLPFGEVTEPSKEAKDPVAARELWETSERVVKEMLQ